MEQWPAEKGRYSLEFAHRGTCIYMYMHVQWSAENGEYCLGFAQRVHACVYLVTCTPLCNREYTLGVIHNYYMHQI